MRPLTDEETRVVFEKLKKYIGANLRQLVDRPDGVHLFRLHKERVFYMSEKVLKNAGHIPKKQLLSAGVCLGKFTHSRKFRLTITALDYLARLAQYRVWLKPAGEQHFVYGNHIVKAHMRRITEGAPKNAGVIILNEQDVPVGFGVTARSTEECQGVGPEALVVYHQCDVGEYLREEADLV
mmetsp:Transcript_4125/g.6626  ORF Transcript_4125/g.6626 Transcript_4125/m.6626 type:complete len:181 (-) Transcript_4125:231-773(-)|eukprot:CAMPEP_0169118416 /NCGR_PEP_ID=MMETSP1015-20121227/30986_1 /TAXON_ID=342587 /ORGANISM="Karlodinium micrum, Strain CCMP2283" /LENGTH=180 /DNA_ID=CAMNT_0009181177 /DNA_START=60 /DNA_END=602 /DNA_ORIENTATION=-